MERDNLIARLAELNEVVIPKEKDLSNIDFTPIRKSLNRRAMKAELEKHYRDLAHHKFGDKTINPIANESVVEEVNNAN